MQYPLFFSVAKLQPLLRYQGRFAERFFTFRLLRSGVDWFRTATAYSAMSRACTTILKIGRKVCRTNIVVFTSIINMLSTAMITLNWVVL